MDRGSAVVSFAARSQGALRRRDFSPAAGRIVRLAASGRPDGGGVEFEGPSVAFLGSRRPQSRARDGHSAVRSRRKFSP